MILRPKSRMIQELASNKNYLLNAVTQIEHTIDDLHEGYTIWMMEASNLVTQVALSW